MIPYSLKTRKKAVALRKKGNSYNQIAKKLSIGKSTVGFWFKNVIKDKKLIILVPKKTLKLKFKYSKKTHGQKKIAKKIIKKVSKKRS